MRFPLFFPLTLLLCLTPLASAAPHELAFEKDIQPLLETYCYKCHDEDVQKGDVQLSGFMSKAAVMKDRKTWLKVLEQLETEEMPTKDPLPTPEEYALMIEWIEGNVNNIDYRALNHPGHVTIPRLTRTEYNRTMRDLLGIPFDAGADLSEDGQGESGFDNDREGLFITPSQMEKYFSAAEQAIGSLLVEDKQTVVKRVESEDMFMTESKSQLAEKEDAKGYVLNRGQMTLYDSVNFPQAGVYEFRVRAWTTGGPTAARLRVNDLVRGDVFVANPIPEVVTIQAFAEKGAQQMAWNIQRPDYRKVAALQEERGDVPVFTVLPENASEIISAESQKNAPLWPVDPNADGKVSNLIRLVNRESYSVQRAYEWLRLHGANGDPDQILRFKGYVEDRLLPLEAAKENLAKELGLTMEEFRKEWERVNQEELADIARIDAAVAHVNRETVKDLRLKQNLDKAAGSVGIDWVEIVGPIRPAHAKDLVLIAEPGQKVTEQEAAETIVRHFLPRAFRRPAEEDEVTRYLGIYEACRKGGQSYPDALKFALASVLVSPKFLFRVELAPGDPEESFALNDFQLASRLSYFLWMTMPDAELMDLAASGELHKPKVMKQQVDRMLKDQRSRIMMESFLGQWLGYSILGESHIPDSRTFRNQYTDDLGWAMREEPLLFFERLVQNNRSLVELLNSRQTFVNEDLAKLYGIQDVPSAGYHLITHKDPNRGGLLGMGAILTTTSTPTRTSPVIRGTWILERLLGEEIPTPPADAGTLPANAGKGAKTLREELALHRDREDCAGCHDKIDPIGFGLENFDGIGQWREVDEKKKPINAQGELPDGASFDGPAQLRNYLLKHRKDEFLRNVTQQMLSFGLGRELELYDEPVVEDILANLQKQGYGAATLIHEVVSSHAFRHQAPHSEVDEAE